MTRIVSCSSLCCALSIYTSIVLADGIILGSDGLSYFSINPDNGQVEDLGLGPPGRGDFHADFDRFAFTTGGKVFSISPGGFDFVYDPFTQQGTLLDFRGSDNSIIDFRQGPDGSVYLLDVFDGIEVIDPDTRATIDTFPNVIGDQLAITSNNELVVLRGTLVSRVDRSNGLTTPLDLSIPMRTLSPKGFGYDAQGNVLFTDSSFLNEIFRLDPATGSISTIATGFNTFGVEYILPGPEGALLVFSSDFNGAVRLIDETTGDTLLSVSRGSGFFPQFVIYSAIPEPTTCSLALAALCLPFGIRRRGKVVI